MVLQFDGFDWDRGNRAKCQKHGLSIALIESLFARPLAILPSAADSQDERRFCAVGQTGNGRRVFLVFTLRRKGDKHGGDKQLIRPISARYMHKKEIESYEKESPGVPSRTGGVGSNGQFQRRISVCDISTAWDGNRVIG